MRYSSLGAYRSRFCSVIVDNIAAIFATLIDTTRRGRVGKLSAAMAQCSTQLHASQAGIARFDIGYTAKKKTNTQTF